MQVVNSPNFHNEKVDQDEFFIIKRYSISSLNDLNITHAYEKLYLALVLL
jgi:hypothetical protein